MMSDSDLDDAIAEARVREARRRLDAATPEERAELLGGADCPTLVDPEPSPDDLLNSIPRL